ncbi:MAG: PrsW family glutamic-type intramembrane protease [Desulfitobacterium sp.]
MTSCLIHAIATGMVGFGLTMAKKFNGSILPILFGLFTLSVTIHALYNLYITSSYHNIGMLMPFVLYLMGLAVLNSKGDNNDKKV